MAYTGKMLRDMVLEKYRNSFPTIDGYKKMPGYLSFLLGTEFSNIPGVMETLNEMGLVFHTNLTSGLECVFGFKPITNGPPYYLFPVYAKECFRIVARIKDGKELPCQLDFSKEFLNQDIMDFLDDVYQETCGNIRALIETGQRLDDFMAAHNLSVKDIYTFKALEADMHSICRTERKTLCADEDSSDFEKSIYNQHYRARLTQDAIRMEILEGAPESRENIRHESISALQLSYRAENSLHRNNIHTIDDLLKTRLSDLRNLRGIGTYCQENILDALRLHGLELQP